MFDKIAETTLSVYDMHCMHCVGKVKEALENVKGVKSAEVSLEKGTAAVKFSDKKTTPAELVEAVKKAGFPCEIK